MDEEKDKKGLSRMDKDVLIIAAVQYGGIALLFLAIWVLSKL